jgi:hypothetical protein
MYLRRLPLFFCGLLLTTAAGSQPMPSLPAPQQQYLPQHQTLSYGVDWRVFPAGTATFHLESDGTTQRVQANGDSIGAVSLLFKVVDRFQSSFDRRTGCSQTFAKQLQEGRRQIVSTLQFQYGAHKQVLDEKNLVKGTSRHLESPIPACVSDLMSSIFIAGDRGRNAGDCCDLQGGGAGRDQDPRGHIPDHPRGAHGGRRRGEEPRQYLDLVLGR